MPRLSCLVGLHRPVMPGEWNLGYCFSTCRHCGRDMVRSVLDGWTTPTAFKVVRGGHEIYDSLDASLKARERPRPPMRARPADVPPAPSFKARFFAPEARRASPKVPDDSPFDFSDFEAGPSADTPQPPRRNAQGR